MRVKYTNGSYIGAEGLCSIDVEQVRDAIVVASNEGFPFRGKPRDMADDVLAHILNKSSAKMGFMPVVYESVGELTNTETTLLILYSRLFVLFLVDKMSV